LLFCFAVLGFIATLGLVSGQLHHRLYWSALIVSSTLGIYTVPTYLYPLLSLLSILGIHFLLHREWQQLSNLFTAGLIVGICSFLLYAPIFWISGLHAIIGNPNVQSLSTYEFWQSFLPYYHYIEGFIIGQERIGVWIYLVLIPCSIYISGNTKHNKIKKLGLLALAYTLLPFVFIIIQQVLTPARILSYRVLFIFLLAGTLYDCIQKYLKFSLGINLITLLITSSFYSVYQIYHLEKRIHPIQVYNEQAQQAYQWLVSKKPKHILIKADYYPLLFYHFSYQNNNSIPLAVQMQRGITYDYIVIKKNEQLPSLPNLPLYEVYQNNSVRIFSCYGESPPAVPMSK
jgi:hypothetical protein